MAKKETAEQNESRLRWVRVPIDRVPCVYTTYQNEVAVTAWRREDGLLGVDVICPYLDGTYCNSKVTKAPKKCFIVR